MNLLVTTMEMSLPPAGDFVLSRTGGVSISRQRLTPEVYLALYREIGEPVRWDSRLRMSREELSAFLENPDTLTFVMSDLRDTVPRGVPRFIGLCEFDCSNDPDIELTNFGIVPTEYGHGFGPAMLDTVLRAVWSREPRRIWLRTDTNDHPRAISVYERAGFRAIKRQVEPFPD